MKCRGTRKLLYDESVRINIWNLLWSIIEARNKQNGYIKIQVGVVNSTQISVIEKDQAINTGTKNQLLNGMKNA